MTRQVLRVGLTGGIASGKSTVARFLTELGAFVLDADALAHETMEPGGAAHASVVARFGRDITDESGRIDRGRLGSLVFSSTAARQDLNGIVHPAVRAEMERRLADHVLQHRAGVVAVFDAALLVESGSHRDFDRLVVTRCSRETQIRRLLARGLDASQALARIEAQAPLETKLAVADHVIDTDGTLAETRRRTAEVHAALVRDLERELG